VHHRHDLEDDAVLDGQPVQLLQRWSDVRLPVKVEYKSSSGILYSLQRRQGRCRKADDRRITVVKARNDGAKIGKAVRTRGAEIK